VGKLKIITSNNSSREIITKVQVDRTVRIGTKLETPTVQLPEAQISEKTVPFETIFQEDPTLEVGQEVEQVAGVNGVIKAITIGEQTTEITTTPKVDRVVKVGTLDSSGSSIIEKDIPFSTIYIEDSSLPLGQEFEQVPGSVGKLKIITSNNSSREIITKVQVDRIIRIGTKLETPTVQLPEAQISERTVPFETIFQEEPTLEAGLEVEQVAGVNGVIKAITIGEQTTEITTTPKVDRVVKVGTRVIAPNPLPTENDTTASSATNSALSFPIDVPHENRSTSKKILPQTGNAQSILPTWGLALLGLVGLHKGTKHSQKLQKRRKKNG
ncbi:LPXTG cell wall anchor domain-containing protein, partial [Streptococcus suis]|nr:LPXTG cell wall anchor domain-containing protein [Streptococcus suis]